MASIISKRAKELNLPIVDADRDEVITLTASDITKGIPFSHDRCAFARACKRSFEVRGVYFFKSTAWLQTPENFIRYILPPNVYREIQRYDAAMLRGATPVMRAGEYKLMQPRHSTTMQAIRKRSAKRRGRHQPARVPTGIKRSPRFANVRQMEIPGEVKTRAHLTEWLRKVASGFKNPPAVEKVKPSKIAPKRRAA